MKHSALFKGLRTALKAAGLAIFANLIAAPASAEVLNGNFTIQQKSSGRYLDAYEGSSDNIAVTRPRETNDTQVWVFNHRGGDTYTIRQKSNGRYLDIFYVPGGGRDSGDKFAVATRPHNTTGSQLWHVTKLADGSYVIRSADGRALEGLDAANDFAVLANTPNDNIRQFWIIRSASSGGGGVIILPLPIPMPTPPLADPSVPPVATPRTFSTGPITLRQTYSADFDRNRANNRTSDIWFRAVTSTRLYLVPVNGATFSVGNRRNRGFSGCSAASYSDRRVPLSTVPVGSYICVKTNEGRISQFRMNHISRRSPKVLKLGYTTWE